MRLIDADALIERIVAEENEIVTDNDHAIGLHNGLTLAQAMVLNAPTAEAEPVRHGRWEKTEYPGILRCSECKDVYVYEEWLERGKWNGCPNCRAKMDKADDEDW